MTAIRPAAVLGARGASPMSRAVAMLLVATITVDAAFLIGLVVTNGDNNPIVNVGLSLATQWIPVTAFWVVAARTGLRNVAVVLAAAAVTFSAIGDAYWALAMDVEGYLPFPSAADAGYLLFYPLMVVALVTLVRRRLIGAGRLVVLETAVATVGASAVLAVLLDPVIDAALAGDTMLGSAVAAAYPMFDLVLLAVVAGIAAVPSVSLERHWGAMVGGLGIFAAADIAYALLEHDGAYTAGTPLDAAWAIGLGLMTWWVVGVTAPTSHLVAEPRRSPPVPLPAVAVLAGLAVLVVGTQVPLSPLAVVLAALTVGLGAVPIVFRQAMLGRMLAARDEAVARLTELDRAKTDMLTTVNHEFRTPLTSINGHVELLLDGGAGDLPPGAVGMLETIERNGARLQSLIDETFTASRFEDGQGALNRSVVRVADLVADAVRRIGPAAERRGITIQADDVDLGLHVDGDAEHLARALGNLLDNAVKFGSPEGRAVVTVDSGAGTEVAIRVTDDGIGIPADDVPRLFSRFFRASNVQKAAIPGVGLGLSTARQIVGAHGGSIDVDSAVGSGTTVTLRLPVVDPIAVTTGQAS